MSDLKLTFAGGTDQNVASDRQRIVDLYRQVRDFKSSVISHGGDFAHYLGVVDDFATIGEDRQSGVNPLEVEFNKAVGQLNNGLADVIVALKTMSRVAKTVEGHVDEQRARLAHGRRGGN